MSHKVEGYTKKILSQELKLNPSQLSFYMNTMFFDELSAVGYKIEMRILPPVVVAKFKELWYGTNLFSQDHETNG